VQPVTSFRTNVMGTVHLLEAVRQQKQVKAVVVVTTDKCYRDVSAPCREEDALGGREPYAASKAGAELVAASYRDSFFDGKIVATARGGNVIGGGDFAADRLIPDMVRAVQAGQAAVIRHPNATRPWQHVLDALHGYLLLGMQLHQRQPRAKAYNFGPADDGVRVGVLAEAFITALGRGQVRHEVQAEAPYESPVLRLDAALAREELGWFPRYDMRQAIAMTAQWYQVFLGDAAQARAITLSQIDDFMGQI
jgi:CDP-glucose 4,6-dehydratase